MEQADKADRLLASGNLLGPLHGVPVTVKDVWWLAGVPTTGGTLGRKDFVPTEDNPLVARLKRAGAIPIGKTNLPEYGCAFETDNLVYGRTNNPYDTTRTPGGSSGGEASIIAAGGSPLGLGGDGAGSLRWPAHCCGVATIKPTWGLVPSVTHLVAGGAGPGGQWVQGGPIARYVEDLALVLPLLAGPAPGDPYAIEAKVRDTGKVSLEQLKVAFFKDNGFVSPTTEIQDYVAHKK